MKFLDISTDTRANCLSILVKMKIKEYLKLVETAYQDKGKLFGQRAPLKTKTAQKIRERMIGDLGAGAILPAVVIGAIVTKGGFDFISENPERGLEKFEKDVDPEKHINIIDGMQRTTALYDAIDNFGLDENKEIRVELWVAQHSNSLLYRMLVLNSGQIPWNLRRQVEIIFRQMNEEITREVKDLKLIYASDQERRSNPGEYQAGDFIELFILFGLKRPLVNLQDQISEEFARLDFAETSSKGNFTQYFIDATRSLVKLDKVVSKIKEVKSGLYTGRFSKGLDLFTSQPSRVGFVVAYSRFIYGLSGLNYPIEQTRKKHSKMSENIENFLNHLDTLDLESLETMIDFPTLSERIKVPTGKVGDFEREFFTRSYTTFFNILETENQITTFSPLWQS